MRTLSLALASTLTLLTAGSALAQSPNEAIGATTVNPPPRQGDGNTGGMGAGAGSGVPTGGGNASVPGTIPGTNIGGSPTSGPPGTGGTAGGPGGVNR